MKKQFLNLALAAAIIGSIATGCSSKNKVDDGDTTKKDTTKVATPPAPAPDTTKKDTMKKDTVHH